MKITKHIQKEPEEIFADNARALRELHDLRQKEVAAAIGTTRERYSKWEEKKCGTPLYFMKAIARFYDKDVNILTSERLKM